MQRPTAEGIQLLVDRASLERGERGPIWGRVCLAMGEQFFPDAGWTDIVVGFCVAWLHALGQLASEATTAETVFFMDGSFRIDIKLTSGDSVELVLVDFHTPETINHRSEQRIASLLRDAITCGQVLLNTAEEQNWVNDQDVHPLLGEIRLANSLLSPGERRA